jgi:hypothetical protein
VKAKLLWFGALAAVALAAADARAQYYPGPQPYPVRVAPDMCNPGVVYYDGCTWRLPSYCVYPPFEPFNGFRPCLPTPCQFAGQWQQQQMGNVAFPVNPWTRSPRDYFMWSEAQQERHTREVRPPFVP